MKQLRNVNSSPVIALYIYLKKNICSYIYQLPERYAHCFLEQTGEKERISQYLFRNLKLQIIY